MSRDATGLREEFGDGRSEIGFEDVNVVCDDNQLEGGTTGRRSKWKIGCRRWEMGLVWEGNNERHERHGMAARQVGGAPGEQAALRGEFGMDRGTNPTRRSILEH